MGIDVTPTLVFGYHITDEMVPDYVEEPYEFFWEFWDVWKKRCDDRGQQMQCVLDMTPIGGDDTVWILGRQEDSYRLDSRYDPTIITPKKLPDNILSILKEHMAFLGLPYPTEKPKWYFGQHIY